MEARLLDQIVFALTGRAVLWRRELPIEVISEGNSRGAWQLTHRRRKEQRDAVAVLVPKGVCPVPCVVIFTRILGKRQRPFDAADNAHQAFKAVRDEVAVRLGVDDKDPRVTWLYGPEERAQTPGIRIEFWPVGER